MAALYALFREGDHVVAQVVETELVAGTVGDIGSVGGLPALGTHATLQEADVHAQAIIDQRHHLGVTPGKVVVDRHDMDAPARDSVEVTRERRDEGLTLTGAHLGDHAHVQDNATDDLRVEVTKPQRPP